MNDFKKALIVGCFVVIFALLMGAGITIHSSLRELNKLRADNNRLIELARDARNTTDDINRAVQQCQFILEDIGETNKRTVGNLREAIDLIEQVRDEVAYIQGHLYTVDCDSINQRIYYWDKYIGENDNGNTITNR